MSKLNEKEGIKYKIQLGMSLIETEVSLLEFMFVDDVAVATEI